MATTHKIQILGHEYVIEWWSGNLYSRWEFECDYCTDRAMSLWRMKDPSDNYKIIDWAYACIHCHYTIEDSFENPNAIKRK